MLVQPVAQVLQMLTAEAAVAVVLQIHRRTHLVLVVLVAQTETLVQMEQKRQPVAAAEQAEQVSIVRAAVVPSEEPVEEPAAVHTDTAEQALLGMLRPYRRILIRLPSQPFWAICKAVAAAQADTIIPAPRMAAVVAAEVALGQPAPTEPQEAITARLLLVVLAEQVLLFSKELHNKNRGEALGYFYSLEKR